MNFEFQGAHVLTQRTLVGTRGSSVIQSGLKELKRLYCGLNELRYVLYMDSLKTNLYGLKGFMFELQYPIDSRNSN